MASINRLFSVLVASGIIFFTATSAGATSITNADFSGGNLGFGTSYLYSATDCVPDNEFHVATDPGACHGAWGHYGDHTTGTGNMMIVNGSTIPGTLFWWENLDVDQNTSYTFSAWVASSISANPAQLMFLIDGSPIGSPYTASTNVGEWTRFEALWNSGAATNVTVGLTDLNTLYGGNDFAVDDIAVVDPPAEVPEPATLSLLGLGFVASAMALRRRRS